jgi:hypothetical protein
MNEKKYVLAKDLPFAKKGATIINNELKTGLCENELCYIKWVDTFEDGVFLNKYPSIGRVRNLLAEGWIEEVKPLEQPKPREIWCAEYIDRNNNVFLGEKYLGDNIFNTPELARMAATYNGKYNRLVHFIEAE